MPRHGNAPWQGGAHERNQSENTAGSKSSHSKATPIHRLPEPLGSAVDAVREADRQWFDGHPDKRWRVRGMYPAERALNEHVAARTVGLGCSCERCAPFVLVVSSPSRTVRWKCASAGDPFCDPRRLCPWLDPALDAADDEGFMRAVLPYLAGRRGAA